MSFSIKRFLPHILVLAGFVILSLAYFSPVLQGKKIFQSDIMHYIGMAQQQKEFAKTAGEETYWTNSAFGGMPTYQLGAKYPHNYIKKLDLTLRFLPRPADYLFLYFLGFYILLLSLKVDFKLAALGALAFGFSTYLIIILGVGHNSKAHAIAYMPMVLAGIILTFRKKYILGFLLTVVALGLEIVANHFQMTYYLLLLVIIIGIAYLIDAYRKNVLPHFFKSVGLLSIAAILAVGLNATNIMATQEYVKASTRGKSELTINPDGSPKAISSGLSKDYITQYSYGLAETFNLYIPKFMGGGHTEDIGKDSETYRTYVNMGASPIEALELSRNAPMYWGDQPIVEAPAYVGAVIIFLFVLGLFLVKGRLKWWLVGGTVLSLLLSYGKNLGFLTDFFIDYVPLYNKFRAVTSIQVILELCIPVLGVFALVRLFNDFLKDKEKLNALKYTVIITVGVCLFFLCTVIIDQEVLEGNWIKIFSIVALIGFLIKKFLPDDLGEDVKFLLVLVLTSLSLFLLISFLFQMLGLTFLDFKSFRDQGIPEPLLDALVKDRKALFNADTIRTLVLVLLSAGTIYLFLKKKLSEVLVVVVFAVLILFDSVSINRDYVNNDNFVSALKVDKPFQANAADKEILKDKGHFRVLDASRAGSVSPARTAYFHNSLFGYHAAKLGRYDELLEFHVYKSNPNVLNMLNTKYIIDEDPQGRIVPVTYYTQPNGNAWFIEELVQLDSANDEIRRLDSLDTKTKAISSQPIPKFEKTERYKVDSLALITLKEFKPNYLKYESNNPNEGFAVFSEIYYKDGWNAYVDGNKLPHYRVNYVLRGMHVPKGNHTIEFKFEPKVVETGSKIALASSALFGILLVLGIFYQFKQRNEES